MKLLTISSFALGAVLPVVAAANPSPVKATPNRPPPKEHISSPASTRSVATVPTNSATSTPPPTGGPADAPPPAEPAKSSPAFDGYLSALNDQLALSKDEQTDIKTYYEQDGARLQAILNNTALSPLEQQRQVDELRNARNAKIAALLKDVDRQARFLEIENTHRAELVQFAAEGGLTPQSPIPNVPQPTATPPAQADKTTPGV